MGSTKPKKRGPSPERLKIEGDPDESVQRLFQPLPGKKRAKPPAKKPRKK